jgi:glycosyltransferase involved in cell wall biosynthesis
VLTYFGKETKYPVIKAVADLGIKIKAFGSKNPYIPRCIHRHPNIKFEGEVSNQKLADLYSNALFTLFTFTHEPFGYVPVESMACQTPVLTYDRQGPAKRLWMVTLVGLCKTTENCLRRLLIFGKTDTPQV